MSDHADEAFFRHLCQHAGVALIATDVQLRIRFWNAAAGRLFGSSAEAMLGEPLISIVPADRRVIAKRLLHRTADRGEINAFEFPHRDPAGTPMFLAVSLSPIIDEAGRTAGVSVCVRDVTRRIETERALADASKMTALGSMAGAIAHHFNNLLGGLVTTADFAQTSDDPAVLTRALRSVVTSLTRAGRLTTALLAFAEGERTDSETEEVTNIVRAFIARLEPRLRQCNIRLETILTPTSARLSAKRLQTILDYLAANACEAMPGGGTLTIELTVPPESGDLVLRISDTGFGMSEADLRHAFEPFYTTKSEGTPGTAAHPGLGLAVVHGIVRSLGGNVTLCSSLGQGTVCSIRIPGNQPTG
ncbi:MAG TPA: ATP-binding protein [Phycisphaerae bacterium]|nr:ATP-binding protein [Phycisphaerae bacterium]